VRHKRAILFLCLAINGLRPKEPQRGVCVGGGGGYRCGELQAQATNGTVLEGIRRKILPHQQIRMTHLVGSLKKKQKKNVLKKIGKSSWERASKLTLFFDEKKKICFENALLNKPSRDGNK